MKMELFHEYHLSKKIIKRVFTYIMKELNTHPSGQKQFSILFWVIKETTYFLNLWQNYEVGILIPV